MGARRRFTLTALALLVAACASQTPAPIVEKQRIPGTTGTLPKNAAPAAPAPRFTGSEYRVQAGDTLYSIAWRLGLDYRALARWNKIQDPHHIIVGQRLKIPPQAKAGYDAAIVAKPAPVTVARTNATAGAARTNPNPPTTQAVASAAATANSATTPVAVKTTMSGWAWPAEGKASRAVSTTGSIGLEIRGQRGQTVRAANRGQVVYSGSGLRGYGQLLIIKHDDTFLSAYAHNDKLLVAEGQAVARGQPIAVMGDSGASEVMLHFEIRKGGRAVEPLQYLPKR